MKNELNPPDPHSQAPPKQDGKMNHLNSVLIEGEIVRDPHLTYTADGKPRCSMTVRSERSFRNCEGYRAEYHDFEITVRGHQAVACTEYLERGRSVRIVGRLVQDRWVDQAGDDRSKVSIIGEHVEFGPKKSKEETDAKDSNRSDNPVGNVV